jgi:hypothetical protein
MTAAARDRFIAARDLRDLCATPAEPDPALTPDDCRLVATGRGIPFHVDGQLQVNRGFAYAAGTFFGQTTALSGRRQRIISGDFSVIDNGTGIRTIDLTGRIAWEYMISDRVMLGYFLGGSLAQTSVDTQLTGQSDRIGLSLGAYFVTAVQPRLYLDGFLAIAASRNTLVLQNVDIRLDGRYGARAVLVGLALSGVIDGPGYELRPEVALGYGATDIRTAAFDATAGGTSDTLTTTVDGVDVATLRITPELRIPVSGDAAAWIAAPSLVCDWTNGHRDCGGGLRLGLRGTSRNRRTGFDILIEADRIGGGDRIALRANVEHRF